jgi:flagellar capping protein FliD
MYGILTTFNTNAGRYRTFGDVGITVGDGAKITFDEDKFREAYATDPDSVQSLFTELDSVSQDGQSTSVPKGLGFFIESGITKLIDPTNGVISQQNHELDQRTQQFQDRITQLNALLDQKRTRLETQFANLESVLSGLQSQQQAIGQIKSISSTG